MAYNSVASLSAGQVSVQDLDVSGGTYLAVTAVAGPTASAAADVSIQVFPYDDNPTGGQGGTNRALVPIPLPVAVTSPANTLVSSKANATAVFFVGGYTKVQIQVKNNNAGALPVAYSYDFQRA